MLLGKFLRIVRKSVILQLTLKQRLEYEMLEAVNNFRKKTLSQMFDKVLNTPARYLNFLV